MARRLSPSFSVSPQITADDITAAAQAGFSTIVCNRPDDEEPGQPSAAELGAHTRELGLSFVHIPVGPAGISRDMLDALNTALDEAHGEVLAYCRSGTRSANLWALAQAASGGDPAALVAAAGDAGYDLRGLIPTLRQLAGQ
jgi:uncharacterized protein (TIGR01244 family)